MLRQLLLQQSFSNLSQPLSFISPLLCFPLEFFQTPKDIKAALLWLNTLKYAGFEKESPYSDPPIPFLFHYYLDFLDQQRLDNELSMILVSLLNGEDPNGSMRDGSNMLHDLLMNAVTATWAMAVIDENQTPSNNHRRLCGMMSGLSEALTLLCVFGCDIHASMIMTSRRESLRPNTTF